MAYFGKTPLLLEESLFIFASYICWKVACDVFIAIL